MLTQIFGYSVVLSVAVTPPGGAPEIDFSLEGQFSLICSTSDGSQVTHLIEISGAESNEHNRQNEIVSIIGNRDIVLLEENNRYFLNKYDASGYAGEKEILVFNAKIDGMDGYYWRELTLNEAFLHGSFRVDRKRVVDRCSTGDD